MCCHPKGEITPRLLSLEHRRDALLTHVVKLGERMEISNAARGAPGSGGGGGADLEAEDDPKIAELRVKIAKSLRWLQV